MAFFGFSDGRPLTRELFVRKLRTALKAMGIEAEKFAGHSFRIGAVTTTATCRLIVSCYLATYSYNYFVYKNVVMIQTL